MTIENWAVGDPIKQSTLAQVYAHINNSANFVVFRATDTFIVPQGVHQFRVYLTGRGGNGSDIVSTIDNDYNGLTGGNSPLISAIISGQSIGASFAVTVGDGTNDGTTKFGTLMQATAGTDAFENNAYGGPGVATFPVGSPQMYHMNGLFGEYQEHPTFGVSFFRGYGEGGAGGYRASVGGSITPTNALAGMSGVCIIQW